MSLLRRGRRANGFASLAAAATTAAAVFLAFSWVAEPVAALKEMGFSKIKVTNSPMVVLFYNPNSASYEKARQVVEQVESRMPQFDFITCNTKTRTNARQARNANLADGVHIFVRTREDGLDEFRMDLSVRNLVRYLGLRGVAGNPAHVLPFSSEEDLMQRIDQTRLPVFVKFFEPWCSHCFRMKRAFEAAATFFQGRINFLEVQCSRNKRTRAFCSKYDVNLYPTLKLFTGTEVLPYSGSRAVAAFEAFFHENRQRFPDNEDTSLSVFNVGKELNKQEKATIGKGFPIRAEDVGVPDLDAEVLTGDALISQGSSRDNDDETEQSFAAVDDEGNADFEDVRASKSKPPRRSARPRGGRKVEPDPEDAPVVANTASSDPNEIEEENTQLKSEIGDLKNELDGLKGMLKELLASKQA